MSNFFDKPTDITEAMRQSLARAYADKDFRDFLTRTAQAAHENALTVLDAGKPEEAQRYANRAKAWKELLEQGKAQFLKFESIRNKLKEPLSKVEVLEEIKL